MEAVGAVLRCCLVCSSTSSLFTSSSWERHAATPLHREAREGVGRRGGVVMVGTREQLLSTTCSTCDEKFPSRWQLHRHILAIHLAPTTTSPHNPTPPGARRPGDKSQGQRRTRSRSREKRERDSRNHDKRSWSRSRERRYRSRSRNKRRISSGSRERRRKSGSRERRNRSRSLQRRNRSRSRSKNRRSSKKTNKSPKGGGSRDKQSKRLSSSKESLKADANDNIEEEREVGGETTKPLEEVTKFKEVERRFGSRDGWITMVLTKGEKDLVIGKHVWFSPKTKPEYLKKVDVKMSRSGERILVTISGSKSNVERVEKKMSKTLSEGISVIMNLDDNQKAAVHRSIGNTESESGAVVNIPRRGEGDQVIISGTPEAVKSAESIITKLTTRNLLKLHDHAARFFLVGRRGETIRSMQGRSGAQILSSRGTTAGKKLQMSCIDI